MILLCSLSHSHPPPRLRTEQSPAGCIWLISLSSTILESKQFEVVTTSCCKWCVGTITSRKDGGLHWDSSQFSRIKFSIVFQTIRVLLGANPKFLTSSYNFPWKEKQKANSHMTVLCACKYMEFFFFFKNFLCTDTGKTKIANMLVIKIAYLT